MFRAVATGILAACLLVAGPASAEKPAIQTTGGILQDYDPAPAMWVLKDEDTTIYMLGTIHVLPPGFRWRNPQLDAIVAEADELVLESTEEQSAISMDRLGPKMQAIADARRPTSEQLSPAVRNKWRALVELSGLEFERTDSMPLMVALLGFGFAGVGADDTGSTYEYGVETVLEEEFRASDRPISGIEDFGYVMLSLFRSRDRLVIRDLEAILSDWSGKPFDPVYGESDWGNDGEWAMEHAWAQGQLQPDMDLGYGKGKLGRTFNRLLLANRNRAWAQWLDQRMEQPGTILLAVGAGHFEGPQSVLAILKERGLETKRIN